MTPIPRPRRSGPRDRLRPRVYRIRSPIGAYWHAVRSLLVVTVLSFLLTKFVLAPDWARWHVLRSDEAFSRTGRLSVIVHWEFLGLDPTAPLFPALAEYALSRLTFEPFLAFLVGGAAMSVALHWREKSRT